MKSKILVLLSCFCALLACSESLEDRAFREAVEFTEKNCPSPLSREITIDSMVFEKPSHTFIYYYSVSPKVDLDNLNKKDMEDLLRAQLKNETALIRYKEAGYSFRYVYYPLTDAKRRFLDVTFKKGDY